jgi:glutamine cyclotransferase
VKAETLSELLELLHVRGHLRAVFFKLLESHVPRVTPQIIRVIPHDPTAFTQGLAYHDGYLYESTGLLEHSSLRKLNIHDGSVVISVDLNDHFGEGIAIIRERIYQLTWKSGVAIIYGLKDLKVVGRAYYSGEGWGLTSTPEGLLMSNGSSLLQIRRPDFTIVRRLRAHSHFLPIRHLNDLEWVNHNIFANILNSDKIMQIDDRTGQLKAIIDCTNLANIEGPRSRENVLNGIAFNHDSGTFLVTGKCWRHLYEVQWGV